MFWRLPQELLIDPQQMNSYSYARNNPINLSDPSARYLESAFDAAMLAWSMNDYNENPGLWNGVSVLADAASLALPIPAIVGGLRHGDDLAKFGKNIFSAQDISKIAKQTNWADSTTLERHFMDHHVDFSSKSMEDYAKQAFDFFQSAEKKGLPTKIDTDGTIRIYDSKTNTFGSYNSKGGSKTFYKPDPAKHGQKTNKDYWNSQKGKLKVNAKKGYGS